MPDSHPLAPLVDAMQANLAAYLRLFVDLPGMVFSETQDVGWFVGVDGPPAREVLWTRFDEGACDAAIDRVLDEVGTHCDRLDWSVYRTCGPADLGLRLEARGLRRSLVVWMLADLRALPPLAEKGPELRVECVTDERQMRIWQDVSARGYEWPTDAAKVYHDAYLMHPYGPKEDAIHYVGYWEDLAVTSSTLLLAQGIAGLYAVSTPPEHRRRGFGGALTSAMLRSAHRRGYRHACLASSRMGMSVYRKAGFNVQINVPEYMWAKAP